MTGCLWCLKCEFTSQNKFLFLAKRYSLFHRFSIALVCSCFLFGKTNINIFFKMLECVALKGQQDWNFSGPSRGTSLFPDPAQQSGDGHFCISCKPMCPHPLQKTFKSQLKCPNAERVAHCRSITHEFKPLYKRAKKVTWKWIRCQHYANAAILLLLQMGRDKRIILYFQYSK